MAIDFSEYVTEFLSIVLLAGLKAGVYYLLQLIIIILRGTGATFMIDPTLAQDTSGDQKILLFYGDAVRMVAFAPAALINFIAAIVCATNSTLALPTRLLFASQFTALGIDFLVNFLAALPTVLILFFPPAWVSSWSWVSVDYAKAVHYAHWLRAIVPWQQYWMVFCFYLSFLFDGLYFRHTQKRPWFQLVLPYIFGLAYQAFNDYIPFFDFWLLPVIQLAATSIIFAFQFVTIHKYREKDNGSEAVTALLITLFFCTCNDLFASELEFIIVIFLLPVLPQTALYCVMTLIKNFREMLFSLIVGLIAVILMKKSFERSDVGINT